MNVGDCNSSSIQGQRVHKFFETDASNGDNSAVPAESFTHSLSAQHGFDLANLDPSVSPQKDFYRYSVGGWINSHTIPDHKTSVGSFDALYEHNQEALHNILESLPSDAPVGSDERKLADFYHSGMDEATIEAAGARPLQTIFDQIAGVSNARQLLGEVANLHNQGIGSMFGFYPTQDAKDSKQNIGEVAQGGLGLPERDYYFEQDDRSKEIRQAYQDHIGRTFQLLGDSPEKAADAASRIMALETKIAAASMTNVEVRDPAATYNITPRAELAKLAPNIDWDGYFKARGQEDLKTVNVATPRFFTGLDKLVKETPIEDWKSYLRWHAISTNSWALSSDFQNENFAYAKVMHGVKQRTDRWKKIVSATDDAMGEALGRKFVETNFPPESKARMQDMLKNIRSALKDDLKSLSWMSSETRAQAIDKLDSITEKIGYPDKWQDYSALHVDKGVFVDNVMASQRWSVQQSMAKIGKPADPSEWGMTPPTVNAYYSPPGNEIVFPAGILQSPFFDPKADDAVNYGAIGVVIGHEITHGFDDSGAQFDGKGNLRNWWSEEDKKHFDQRSQGIINQANDFVVKDDLHLKGPLVVGEAMADLGGVELAYQALQKSMEGKPHPDKVDGFTPEQRFFLGFSQVWATNTRPEAEEEQVRSDPHPTAAFRVNGTLSNVPEFAQAFGAKDGDPMVRPEDLRTILWETPKSGASSGT